MIPLHKVFMPQDLDEVLNPLKAVLESGWIGEGPKTLEFEEALASILGSPQVTVLNSCTSALQLALRLAGVTTGDEVRSTALCPVRYAGAAGVTGFEEQ